MEVARCSADAGCGLARGFRLLRIVFLRPQRDAELWLCDVTNAARGDVTVHDVAAVLEGDWWPTLSAQVWRLMVGFGEAWIVVFYRDFYRDGEGSGEWRLSWGVECRLYGHSVTSVTVDVLLRRLDPVSGRSAVSLKPMPCGCQCETFTGFD